LLKDFKSYVEEVSQKIKAHADQLANEAGQPIRYLENSITAKNGQSKEALTQKIAEENQVKSGLVYVFYTQKPWPTFTMRSNHQAQTCFRLTLW